MRHFSAGGSSPSRRRQRVCCLWASIGLLLSLAAFLPLMAWELSSQQDGVQSSVSASNARARAGGAPAPGSAQEMRTHAAARVKMQHERRRKRRRDIDRGPRAAAIRGGGGRRSPRRSSEPRYNATMGAAGADGVKPYVAFLHIGKTGGTSFDKLMRATVRDLLPRRRYVGNKHFDWSYIDLHFDEASVDVLTLLRDPASRAISHFYFARTLPWTQGKKIRTIRLTDYLADKELMMDTRTIWQDGQAAIRWLTGTKIAQSVATDPAISVEEREELACNITHMCLLAAERLNRTAWFGLLERLDESMDMLASVLGLPDGTKLELPTSNSGRYPPTSAADREALASLMPMDNWLYGYAGRLFEARLAYHRGVGPYVDPDLPPLPEISCFSSRFALECEGGPLASVFPRDPSQSSVYREMRQ